MTRPGDTPVLSLREARFTSHWHHETVAARLGLWLGIAFTACFATGLLSHLIQHPPVWFVWPTRPVGLYRVTQGVHVLTGIAAVPLLLAKLWTVYPRLFVRPPVRSPAHAAERGSVALLVASALFELVSGLQNIAHWYPWGFAFPPAHFAVAWLAIGSVALHVAVKAPQIRRGLGAPLAAVEDVAAGGGDSGREADRPSRRWLLGAAASAGGVLVLATAGMTVPALRRVSVLAVRSGGGPQGIPVNKSAASARVLDTARDPRWRLTVAGIGGRQVELSLDDLRAMPQASADLPIACVEGWSAAGRWEGVRLAHVLALVGAPEDADIGFVSLQRGGAYGTSVLPARHARDRLTLLALGLAGGPLDLDHGYPCRLIAPSRPGVLQTKWLSRVEVRA